MKWETVKIKEYNGFKIEEEKAYAKGKKFVKNRYPSEKTINTLKNLGIKEIKYKNGDTIKL